MPEVRPSARHQPAPRGPELHTPHVQPRRAAPTPTRAARRARSPSRTAAPARGPRRGNVTRTTSPPERNAAERRAVARHERAPPEPPEAPSRPPPRPGAECGAQPDQRPARAAAAQARPGPSTPGTRTSARGRAVGIRFSSSGGRRRPRSSRPCSDTSSRAVPGMKARPYGLRRPRRLDAQAGAVRQERDDRARQPVRGALRVELAADPQVQPPVGPGGQRVDPVAAGRQPVDHDAPPREPAAVEARERDHAPGVAGGRHGRVRASRDSRTAHRRATAALAR